MIGPNRWHRWHSLRASLTLVTRLFPNQKGGENAIQEFINEWKSGIFTFNSLCESYGISRTLGYRLCRRFEEEQEQGLEPRSRAPHSVANRTLTEVEFALCELRLKYRRFRGRQTSDFFSKPKGFTIQRWRPVYKASKRPSESWVCRTDSYRQRTTFRKRQQLMPLDPVGSLVFWIGNWASIFWPWASRAEWASRKNAFVHLYNEIRPHDALGKKPPANIHEISPRWFPEKIREWDYPKEFRERYVCRNGSIRWGQSKWIGVTTALNQKRVGLEEIGDGIWRVYFRQKLLGHFNEKVLRIQNNQGKYLRNRV